MAEYYNCNCFWCNKSYKVRSDVYKRQIAKYNHVCCQQCFGKEPSFKDARKRIMLNSNPFKGKKHTKETLKILSQKKIGKPSWNKGLTKETNESIKYGGKKVSEYKKGKHLGSNNPNWKGGISAVKKPVRPELKEWLIFRYNKIKDDCFKCIKCNNTFFVNQLDVHHIAPRREFKELEFDETNCITLCRKCHKEFHKKFGRKNTSPGATYKWINETRNINDYFMSC